MFGKPNEVPASPIQTMDITVVKHNAALNGFNQWTLNGRAFSMPTNQPIYTIHPGGRYRLRFRNASDDIHPLHLHRHIFELTKVGGKPTAGVMKDVVMLGGFQEVEFDFVADNPGMTLFHCISNCTWTSVSCFFSGTPKHLMTRFTAHSAKTGELNRSKAGAGWSATSSLHFVLLFGAVNLFADMTYEGVRSITGPFLASLGASGLVVGSVTGFGEFLGYALRLVSGPWADRSRLYWATTIAGYIVQMFSVPTLALARIWPVAGILILLERSGRATRNPPRDVMLSEASETIGRGWAFGLNEGLDQRGALIGPLVVAGMLAWRNDFQLAFTVLAIPAVLTLLLVGGARVGFPNAGRIEHESKTSGARHYPPVIGFIP